MHRPTIRRRAVPALSAALLAAALTIAGCGAGADNGASSGAADKADQGVAAPAQDTAAGAAAPGTAAGTEGKGAGSAAPAPVRTYVIRTAELGVETKDVEGTAERARSLVTDAGGYVGDESTTLDDKGRQSSRLQLRVPPEEYERLLDELGGLGTLLSRKVDAEDVTGQVVDVESRIKSARVSVARVRELMDQATKLSDVVTLEGELSTREADLEALEAQQSSLKERTGTATVTLALSLPDALPAPEKKAEGIWGAVSDALGDGWHAFYVTFRAILITLAAVLPFGGLGLAGWFVYRVVRRRLPERPRHDPYLAPPAPVSVPAPLGAPAAPRAGTDPEPGPSGKE